MSGQTHRFVTLLVVVVALIGLTGLPVAGQSVAVTDAPADAATPNAATVQQDATCDYQQLYNQTIDSVVLVGTPRGQGSGFVFEVANDTNTSYVVTNQHVVGDSGVAEIKFRRGEIRRGRVIGISALTDLAVIRVNQTPEYVESLPLADSPAQPGQRVAAIGSPYGLNLTLTTGAVSGVDRTMPTRLGQIPNAILTDATISPGNSGGPLVRCSDGAVLGVNRAGVGDIGFAISANVVGQVVPELIENGTFQYPFLGVRVADVSLPIAEANNLNTTEGVFVVDTLQGAPVSEVLQPATGVAVVDGQRVPVGGDVILEIGNQTVEEPGDIGTFLLTQTQPGETVELTILRNGTRQTVNVTVIERPGPRTAANSTRG